MNTFSHATIFREFAEHTTLVTRFFALTAIVLLTACTGRVAIPASDMVETSLQALDKAIPPIRLRMPSGYVRNNIGWWEPFLEQPTRTPLNEPQVHLLLHMTWPELLPKQKDNQNQFLDPMKGVLDISIEAIPNYEASSPPHRLYHTDPELELIDLIALREDFETRIKLLPMIDHLPKYGLKVRGISKSDWNAVDTHRKRDFNQIMTAINPVDFSIVLIKCEIEFTAEPETLNPIGDRIPHCQHSFAIARLDAIVKIHYRRKYLENWREIQYRVREKLLGFVVN